MWVQGNDGAGEKIAPKEKMCPSRWIMARENVGPRR